MRVFVAAMAMLLVAAAPVAAQTDQKAVEPAAAPDAGRVTAETAAAAPTDAETSGNVPELEAFHEVIFPLWHNAYPAGDTTMMRSLWPQIQEHIAAVNKAELPGILRDKKDAWQQGLGKLHTAEIRYGAALSAHDKDALLKAAEELHGSFEGLVRVIRPVLPEMAGFHEVLYKVYHYDMPKKDLLSFRAHLPALEAEMDTLSRAELPKRREAQKETFEKARAELQAKMKVVSASLDTGVWADVESAVEEMHTAYQKLEKVFE